MGTRLVVAPQVRNTIESMLQSGVLAGDIATAWNARLKEKLMVTEFRRKAEAGDAEMQYALACAHEQGTHGMVQDMAKAFKWFNVLAIFFPTGQPRARPGPGAWPYTAVGRTVVGQLYMFTVVRT